ncbi:MAG TPA: hypothetical protein PLQ93_07115 [Bacteroidia bacterium]|nr:hypothetical protein [Bacteroidia bacterium]
MKKITLLAVLVLGISLVSCSKDRTCTCTESYTSTTSGGPNAGTQTSSQVTTTTLKDVNGKSARSNCLSGTATMPAYSDGAGGTVTDSYKADCKLD